MQEIREIGSNVQKIMQGCGLSASVVCEHLECTLNQYNAFLEGRMFLSFEQLETLAELFFVDVSTLFEVDVAEYQKNIVHYNGEFENPENLEGILDILEDYIWLRSVVV